MVTKGYEFGGSRKVVVIIVVAVSMLLIAFNIWRIIKKYRNKNGGNIKFLLHDIILNLLLILLGVYLILMVLGQIFLLKALILLMGLNLIGFGFYGIRESIRTFRKTGWLSVFLIKVTVPLIGFVLGLLFILISIASLRRN
ncbi:MAG TPA: hypothetical protein VHT96_03635 [Clostridia bacterium]|nr:hypothetical protein [Clostridia bacterium]